MKKKKKNKHTQTYSSLTLFVSHPLIKTSPTLHPACDLLKTTTKTAQEGRCMIIPVEGSTISLDNAAMT